MKFKLKNGDIIYKIGITTRKVEKRFSEVLMSMHACYRYVPMAKLIRFTGSNGFMQIEKDLHERFEDCKYHMDEGISGYSEFFMINNGDEVLREAYDAKIEEYKNYVYVPKQEFNNNTMDILGISGSVVVDENKNSKKTVSMNEMSGAVG